MLGAALGRAVVGTVGARTAIGIAGAALGRPSAQRGGGTRRPARRPFGVPCAPRC